MSDKPDAPTSRTPTVSIEALATLAWFAATFVAIKQTIDYARGDIPRPSSDAALDAMIIVMPWVIGALGLSLIAVMFRLARP